MQSRNLFSFCCFLWGWLLIFSGICEYSISKIKLFACVCRYVYRLCILCLSISALSSLVNNFALYIQICGTDVCSLCNHLALAVLRRLDYCIGLKYQNTAYETFAIHVELAWNLTSFRSQLFKRNIFSRLHLAPGPYFVATLLALVCQS